MHYLFVRLSTRYKINIMSFLTYQEYARIEKKQRKIRENQLKIQNVEKARLKKKQKQLKLSRKH